MGPTSKSRNQGWLLPYDFFAQRFFARSRKDGSKYEAVPETIRSNPIMKPFLLSGLELGANLANESLQSLLVRHFHNLV
jgi:hypothetical protein